MTGVIDEMVEKKTLGGDDLGKKKIVSEEKASKGGEPAPVKDSIEEPVEKAKEVLVKPSVESLKAKETEAAAAAAEKENGKTEANPKPDSEKEKPPQVDADDDAGTKRKFSACSTTGLESDGDSPSSAQAAKKKAHVDKDLVLNPSLMEDVDKGTGAFGKSVIEFAFEQNWHTSYVRTRHKNLRCFPFCAPSHKERSFCGLPVSVLVRCASMATARKLHIVGRFRKARDSTLVNLGDTSSHLNESDNDVILGSFVQYNPTDGRALFEFSPPRKWRYHCEQNKYTTAEMHTFTAYIFDEQNKCTDIKDSPHFRIVSAWRQSVNTVSRPYNPSIQRRPSDGMPMMDSMSSMSRGGLPPGLMQMNPAAAMAMGHSGGGGYPFPTSSYDSSMGQPSMQSFLSSMQSKMDTSRMGGSMAGMGGMSGMPGLSNSMQFAQQPQFYSPENEMQMRLAMQLQQQQQLLQMQMQHQRLGGLYTSDGGDPSRNMLLFSSLNPDAQAGDKS